MFGSAKYRLLSTLIAGLATIMGASRGMAKLHLFSEVNGVVLKSGTPISGAVVEQEFVWSWNDEVGRTSVKTDTLGQFRFPAQVRHSLLASLLPHEPRIKQTILIRYSGETFQAWLLDKSSYKEDSELGGRPIALICDLDAAVEHQGEVYGMCRIQTP